jgi:hypothetical protein
MMSAVGMADAYSFELGPFLVRTLHPSLAKSPSQFILNGFDAIVHTNTWGIALARRLPCYRHIVTFAPQET